MNTLPYFQEVNTDLFTGKFEYPVVGVFERREKNWDEGTYRLEISTEIEVRREHCLKRVYYSRGITYKNFDKKKALDILEKDLLEYIAYTETLEEEPYTAYQINIKLP